MCFVGLATGLVHRVPLAAGVEHEEGIHGLSSIDAETIAPAGHVHAYVIIRVGTSQCRHPPWLHLRFEDKLGQTHGGIIAARQGQVHHALRTQQRVRRRKELI
jgi:hypothetical protein